MASGVDLLSVLGSRLRALGLRPSTAFKISNSGAGSRTQRLQYPSVKEYTLNHIRDPTII